MEGDMSTCIDDCLRCYRTCLDAVAICSLAREGAGRESGHVRLMMACAELCRTAAHLMLLRSPHHVRVCEQCATVCAECAKECERVGGLEECVEACEFCADSCQAMSN